MLSHYLIGWNIAALVRLLAHSACVYVSVRCVRLNLECRPNPRPPGRPQILNTPILGATGAVPSAHEPAARGLAPRPERVLNRLLTPTGALEGSAEAGAVGARQPVDAVPAALGRFLAKGTLVADKARWIL